MSQRRRVTPVAAVNLVRRAVVVAVVIASIAGFVAVARRSPAPVDSAVVVRQVVPEFRASAKASTWFCPGVPGNDDSISGLLVISNSGEAPVGGTITRFALDGAARRQRFAVPARSTLEIDANVGLDSQFVSAFVESQGAAVAVERETSDRAADGRFSRI